MTLLSKLGLATAKWSRRVLSIKCTMYRNWFEKKKLHVYVDSVFEVSKSSQLQNIQPDLFWLPQVTKNYQLLMRMKYAKNMLNNFDFFPKQTQRWMYSSSSYVTASKLVMEPGIIEIQTKIFLTMINDIRMMAREEKCDTFCKILIISKCRPILMLAHSKFEKYPNQGI